MERIGIDSSVRKLCATCCRRRDPALPALTRSKAQL
jgi:hypothetical protein